LQCHLCGQWFRFIGGTHLTCTHGWTLAEYRETFMLRSTVPTCSRGLSEKRRVHTRQRIAAGELPATIEPADSAAGREARAKRAPARWASLAVNHPELISELHPTRNGRLDPTSVAAGSNRKLWWRCDHGHDWFARIADRSGGTGCPACANARRGRLLGVRNQRVSSDRTLAIRFPSLLAQLHPTRNTDLDPGALAASSKRKVWWICGRGHEWRATVGSRTAGTGCPACAPQRRAQTIRANGPRVPTHRSLAAKHPELLAELHTTRNQNLDPRKIAAGSTRRIWWRCQIGHDWQARVNDRSHGSGCPVCAKQRPIRRERSLAVKHPTLLNELHPALNGALDPFALGAGSNRKLWWRCAHGHDWQATVAARGRGTGCPICARTRVPSPRSLAMQRPALVAQLHPTRNPDIDPATLAVWSNRQVWWRCAHNHEWESIVASRSAGAGCPVCHQQHRCVAAKARGACPSQ